MSLPVVAVRLPNDLVGAKNGQLPASVLSPVDGGGQLHHYVARAFRALHAYALGAGLHLTYTYGGCYRKIDDQVTLFRNRYTLTPLLGRPTKTWEGRTWWQRPNTAMAAVPGTSNHGWGLAIDLAVGDSPATARPIGTALPWLVGTAPSFGFSWETQSEEWHVRYVAGEHIPQAVLDYEQVPAPPKDDDMATVRVLVEGRVAEFWTQCPLVNGVPSVLWMVWSGAGGPEYERFHANHAGPGGGVIDITVTPQVIRENIMLIGSPEDIHGETWTEFDFYRCVR